MLQPLCRLRREVLSRRRRCRCERRIRGRDCTVGEWVGGSLFLRDFERVYWLGVGDCGGAGGVEMVLSDSFFFWYCCCGGGLLAGTTLDYWGFVPEGLEDAGRGGEDL